MSLEQVHARARAHAELKMVIGARCTPARCAHLRLLRHYLQACRDEIVSDTECTGCDLRSFCAVALPAQEARPSAHTLVDRGQGGTSRDTRALSHELLPS